MTFEFEYNTGSHYFFVYLILRMIFCCKFLLIVFFL